MCSPGDQVALSFLEDSIFMGHCQQLLITGTQVAEDKIPVPGWLDHIPSLCCIYQPIGHGCDLSVCVKYNCVCVRVRILLWAPAAGATKGCGNVVGGEEWR